METWNDIPGYEGAYQVSSEGNVRSLDRVYECIVKGIEITRRIKGRILRPYPSRKYKPCLRVSLGSETPTKVHRLVAGAFIPNPNNYNTVDHINRDPFDNRVCNLRWASMSLQSENRDSPIGVLGHKYISKTKCDHYRVRVTRNSTRKIVGTYKTLQEAITARDQYLDSLE